MRKTIFAAVALSIIGWAGAAWAWNPDEVAELEPKVAETIKVLLEKDPDMQKFFDKFILIFVSTPLRSIYVCILNIR